MAGLFSRMGANAKGMMGDPEMMLALGSGLLSGGTFGEQVGGAFGNAAALKAQRKGLGAEAQKLNKTVEFLRKVNPELAAAVDAGAMSPGDAYKTHLSAQQPKQTDFDMRAAVAQQYGIDPNSPEGRAFILGGKYVDPNNPAGGTEYGLNPIYATDAKGGTVLMVPGKDGSIKQLPVPEGVKPLAPYDKAFEAARGREAGQYLGNQQATAKKDVSAADQALSVLDQIETSPYLDRGTGFSSFGNAIPGTGGYDFQNLVNQAKSGAFLAAIQQMRGLGQLSNAEGDTARAAISRMDTATSKEAFLKALADYRAIIETGKANAISNLPQSGANAGGGIGKTSSGIGWSIEP